jgi:hypothetical protein
MVLKWVWYFDTELRFGMMQLPMRVSYRPSRVFMDLEKVSPALCFAEE